jgi:hypothetical protein
MAFHEAGHALLAIYYGYQIGGFTCWYTGQDWTGKLENRRIPNAPLVDTLPNLITEAQKTLAGELAARIRAGIDTQAIVLPLISPDPHTVGANTPFDELEPPGQQKYDGIKILARYHYNRDVIPTSWWIWMRDRHGEARQILDANWPVVGAIAQRFLTVNPTGIDPANGHRMGRVDGTTVLQWCQEAGAPVLDPNVTSIAY